MMATLTDPMEISFFADRVRSVDTDRGRSCSG
jgi:hypothetical protein